MTKKQIEKINAKIENESFDYWATEYAESDLTGDHLALLKAYLETRRKLIDSLERDGVETLQ